MTRINVGVLPQELSGKHLIAEHREIKRIPNQVKKLISKNALSLKDIPLDFKLGKGHVKFFYNKLGYLLKRYLLIYKECKLRNYNVQDYKDAWYGIPIELLNDYKEKAKDREIILERIKERS